MMREGVAGQRLAWGSCLLAGTMLSPAALAQTAPVGGSVPNPSSSTATGQAAAATGGLEEIVVTAQKRSENLQNVPISIQAFGTRKLEELNVNNFEDYAKLLPSLTFQSLGPGFTRNYFRGVVSGGDGNHSGPAAVRRHLFGRAAGHHDQRHAGRTHL